MNADSSICTSCSQEYSSMSGLPVLLINKLQPSLNASFLNSTWDSLYNVGDSQWYIPLGTGTTGILEFQIDSNKVLTPRLALGGLKAKTFFLHVEWFSNLLVILSFSDM